MKYIGNIEFTSTGGDDVIAKIKQNEHSQHPQFALDKESTKITISKMNIVVSNPCVFLINDADLLEVDSSYITSDNFRIVAMKVQSTGVTVNITYEYGDYYIRREAKTEGGGDAADLTPEQSQNISKIPTIESNLTTHTNNTAIHHTHANKAVLDGITSGKIAEWNGKSNFNGDYNSLTNKPTIPSIDGLITVEDLEAFDAQTPRMAVDIPRAIIWYGSLVEYNAIATKDPSTIYFVSEE